MLGCCGRVAVAGQGGWTAVGGRVIRAAACPGECCCSAGRWLLGCCGSWWLLLDRAAGLRLLGELSGLLLDLGLLLLGRVVGLRLLGCCWSWLLLLLR